MKGVLYNAVENVFSNPATIQSGFRRACLFPFGPENMDWSKFSSSKVFGRPGQENVEIRNILINNNNMYPAPELCGDAKDIADPVLRAHPLPPPSDLCQTRVGCCRQCPCEYLLLLSTKLVLCAPAPGHQRPSDVSALALPCCVRGPDCSQRSPRHPCELGVGSLEPSTNTDN